MDAAMDDNGLEDKPLAVRSKLNLSQYISLDNDAPKVVPESDLRALTQGPLKCLILESGNYEQSLSLWNCLFHTLEDTALTTSHQTSVCNAICAFLEAALTARDPEICQFARSKATWLSIFEVYLDRFEYNPAKPMKQILATLTNILATHPESDTTSSIRSYLIESVVKTILLAEPLARLKASVVSLHFLIRKDAFPAVDLISRLQEWLRANGNCWIPVIGEHSTNVGLDIPAFTDSNRGGVLASQDEQGLITAQIFCLVLLLHLQNANVVTSSGALLSQLCFKLKKESEAGRFRYSTSDNGAPFWAAPLKYLALRNLDNLDSTISLAFHLLFRGRLAEFQSFLDILPLEDLLSENYSNTGTTEFALLIAVLETGKELGLIHEDQAPNSSSTDKFLVLESQKLRLLLIHSNAKIRVRVLSLLISAPSTTKPFSPDALLIFKEMIPFVHAEADAHVRSELVSLIRRLTVRLRGGSSPRQLKTEVIETNQNSQYLDAKTFVSWYIEFLQSELRLSASYQTHILALKALATLLQSGLDPRIDSAKLSKIGNDQKNWPFAIDIFTTSLFRALGDLLINPYEEIRMTSLAILRLFPLSFIKPQSIAGDELGIKDGTIRQPYHQLLEAFSRAEEMAGQTSRADHADGLARIYHFLFDLAENGRGCNDRTSIYNYKYDIVDLILTKLEKVTSLSDIATLRNTPIHGHLSALRYIMATPNFYSLISSKNDLEPSWRIVLKRTLLLCEAMWSDVQAVLCVDSPEREHGDSAVDLLGPKDILSCCWRALRESSLLLNAILSNTSYAPLRDGLNYEEYSRVGNLTFSQLAELRHRGAFSAVSQTFVSCCQRCSLSKDKAIASLPETWFTEILSTIHGQSSKLTRRSAGLPALALGVASSAKPLFFHEIMEKLQGIAKVTPTSVSEQLDMRLPQVHAMNCLKDIFTATNLATVTEEYLMPALSISAECLGSEMFPGLIPLLTGLLEKGAPKPTKPSSDASLSWELSITTERVFPALELIGKKFPSPASNEDKRILESISWQFESPVWGIRDHAARTYASLVDRDDILPTALRLSQVSIQAQNQLHGSALCIKYLLRRIWAAPGAYYQYITIDHFDTISRVLNLNKYYGQIISNPQMKSSIIRSSSLFLESITFGYLMIGVLLHSSQEELTKFIQAVSAVDVNVPASVLERFHQAFISHLSSRNDRLKLYCRMITEAPSKREAVGGKLGELSFLIPWSSTFPISEEDNEPFWDREMVDASIRLQGCLLSLSIRQSPNALISNSAVAARFKRLAQQLSISIHDETVFTTRFAAVTSLKSVVLGLTAAEINFSQAPILVDAIFVLYDMLNDDDVEIREAAALIASKVLADESMVFRLPAAAATAIADFLTIHYCGSSQVFEGGLQRFLGAASQKKLFVPAAEVLNKAIKESTALFAEEKQNLYIDDVREIKTWSRHLVRLDNTAINVHLYQEFHTWVIDGLDALTKIAGSHPKDSLLGWTSNVDVFVTGLRVLYGAKMLLITHRQVSADVNIAKLHNKLQALYNNTSTTELNPAWISLQESLLTANKEAAEKLEYLTPARMQHEAQAEEAARCAREAQQAEQIAELTAIMTSHSACRAQPIQQPQLAHVAQA
ncbi:HEAT repeat protein [Microsporum canis CBS 113480]|uniref:HEAT repeat protein n=1 Tax=Arthroderma otae (strain ATCC MYA-4605 / CBS 113480) TaxID=554155 RepID=C5FN04_ARTOC|nr:HEAT repeat protein [Microsporum canis CBS 113480]EEQ31240.1 HEAT repeat protein [Microsporum canis CBS 113480]